MKILLLPFALTFFSLIVFAQNDTTWFGPVASRNIPTQAFQAPAKRYSNTPARHVSCSLSCSRENNVLKYNTRNTVFCDSIPVDAPEPRLDDQLYLYPNPAGSEVLPELPAGALPARLRLFDPQGKLLKEEEIIQI